MILALYLLLIASGDAFLVAGSFPSVQACEAAATQVSEALATGSSNAVAFCTPIGALDALRGAGR